MRWLAVFFLLVIGSPATAQLFCTVNGQPCVTSSAILGTYAIAGLPACNSSNQAKYAFVTDLGGGADMTLCDGTSWKHIRLGTPATINATSGTVTLTPLVSAPIQIVTSNPVGALTVSIASAGLYDGEVFYIRKVGLLTGTIGLQLATGGTSIPILANSTSFVVYSAACACLQQIQ